MDPSCCSSSERMIGAGSCMLSGASTAEAIEQAAGSRLVIATNMFRSACDDRTEAAQRGRRGLQGPPAGLHRETCMPASRSARERLQRTSTSTRKGSAGSAGKGAAFEHGKARNGQPFRTSDGKAGLWIVVAPLRSGAGIEQDADDGEVEFRLRARCRGSTTWVRLAIAAQRSSLPTTKVPPARMKGELSEGRIGLARRLQHEPSTTASMRSGWMRKFGSLSSSPIANMRCARSRTALALSSVRAAGASGLARDTALLSSVFRSGRPIDLI